MDNLTMAAQAGNIDRLYELIAENPTILAQIDEIPFVNTPFHTAAEAGCTHFAIEIMSLMPSFARKLNPDGLSPLDLALRKGHDELVKRLIEIDSELIRVKGKERWTPLHYVAKMDNIDLLADFLFACPLSINDVTIRKENALHIAAANGKIRALEVLMGWIERTDSQHVLRRKDEKGNTLLHVVASNSVLYGGGLRDILVKLRKEIGAAERNSDGLKAFDIISQSQLPHQLKEAAKRVLKSWQSDSSVDSFSKFLRSEIRVSEMLIQKYFRIKWSLTPEKVNCILVVVTLVVTASYQAAVQPPTANGLNGDCSINSCNITATFIENNNSTFFYTLQKDMLTAFYTLHTLVFTIGISIIIVVIELNFVTCLVHLTLFFLYLNYMWLLSRQDIDEFASSFTSFTFISTYMILPLKLAEYKIISLYPQNLFLLKPYYKYIVKIQFRMTSSKYHGLLD